MADFPQIHSLALNEYQNERYVWASQLLGFVKTPDLDLQKSAVMCGLLDEDDASLQKLFEAVEVVPSLEVFGKVVCESMRRGWVDEANRWGDKMAGREESLRNWHNFVVFLCGFGKELRKLGIIEGEGQEEVLVVEKLDKMEEDWALVCSTGLVLAKFVDDDPTYFRLICKFLRLYPILAKFAIGCLCGYVSKSVGEDEKICVEALGVFGAFGISIPQNSAIELG